ncbi:MAG: tRNA (adenosine(37)-N6)-dimethylallyltransferase MiaA [Alphaproteobacteria bacterium]|nr:tRNA (adenosine(37)-N6)-dimethylallyltransferase MiaA [Alphaproteobacteria bacterium SS10]
MPTKRQNTTKVDTKPVLIVAGPTASGKSGLAMKIAEQVGGVVINADSMQLYRELRLITARPSEADMSWVPHRLYGVLAATDSNSAADWRRMALEEISAAHDRGKIPILTGGTGFYLKALLEGLSPIPPVPPTVAAETRQRVEEEGVEAVHAALKARDPVMASKLRSTDAQRVARAWAVLQATGQSLADWQALAPEPPPAHLRFFAMVIMPARAGLYREIDARFAMMAAKGGVDEVRAFLAMDPPEHTMLLRAVGVPELRAYIEGETDLETAITSGQQATRHYAKRQFTWFRNQLGPTDISTGKRNTGRHAQQMQVSHVEGAQLSESLWAQIENFIQ